MSDELNMPWRYDYEPGYCGELIAANGSVICTFTDEPSPKDAAHIVRCVNSHDALVSALRDFLSDFAGVYADGEPAVIHAKAALAAATKELS